MVTLQSDRNLFEFMSFRVAAAMVKQNFNVTCNFSKQEETQKFTKITKNLGSLLLTLRKKINREFFLRVTTPFSTSPVKCNKNAFQ